MNPNPQRSLMIRSLLAAGVLSTLLLLLGCAGEKQASVDCGLGETVSTDDLPEIVLNSDDVGGDLASMPTSEVAVGDLGDQYFKDTVEPSRYVGGFMAAFASGDVLQGGKGRLVTSMVMSFGDADAAKVLVDHPYVGEASVDRAVETPTFGDATDSRYVEVSDGQRMVGHIIQFRVNRVVMYIGNLAVGENPALSETVRLARLVCDRIRERGGGAEQWQMMGDSMLPSIADGTTLKIAKYGGAEPQRGDVVLFRSPSNPDRYFVKRVIGLPGETVEIRTGVLYINGEPWEEPYISGTTGCPCGPWMVEPGRYFVLGDHRNNSSDSRVIGTIAEDAILGRAKVKD